MGFPPILRLLALSAGIACFGGTTGVLASDHRESPEIVGKPGADIADFYAFLNPRDPTKIVFVTTVNGYAVFPIAKSYQFSPTVRYLFKIDSNGDAVADHQIELRFSGEERFTHPDGRGGYTSQRLVTRFSPTMGIPPVFGVATPATQVVNHALEPVINEGARGVKVFAGLRDDPFYFDLVASDRVFAGQQDRFSTAIDRFAYFSVSAIVVEVPLDAVYREPRPLQVWATTEEYVFPHGWRQIQRVGNPAVKGVYVPDNLTERFNASEPKNDVRDYREIVQARAQALFGLNDQTLSQLMTIIMPDTLKIDPRHPVVSPNGRGLNDDLDAMFWFNLNAPIAYAPGDLDGVHGNDIPNDDYFPYLAPPRSVP